MHRRYPTLRASRSGLPLVYHFHHTGTPSSINFILSSSSHQVYEEEITRLEQQRGVDVKFVNNKVCVHVQSPSYSPTTTHVHLVPSSSSCKYHHLLLLLLLLCLPQPGYVLKVPEAVSKKKLFINMCQSDTLLPATQTRHGQGQQWNIPYCITPLREDLDKSKMFLLVFLFFPFSLATFPLSLSHSSPSLSFSLPSFSSLLLVFCFVLS